MAPKPLGAPGKGIFCHAVAHLLGSDKRLGVPRGLSATSWRFRFTGSGTSNHSFYQFPEGHQCSEVM